jgi:hypothetical protein
MGNYYCKSFREAACVRPQYDTERVCFTKTVDKGLSGGHSGENIYKCESTRHLPMSEFIRICSLNRPKKISDTDWWRFVYNTYIECFTLGVPSKLHNKAKAEFTGLSCCVPSSPSLSSIDAVKSMQMEESTRLSLSQSFSSVEFAGPVAFPDISGYNQLSSETILGCIQNDSDWSERSCSSSRLKKDFSSPDKFGCESDMVLKSRFTAYRLGDLPSDSCEESLFYNENKHSTSADSSITEAGGHFAGQVLTGGDGVVLDEYKVNLRITRAL